MPLRTNFYYDPATQGLDPKVLRTLYGTPSIATGALVLSDAAVIHTAALERGEYSFEVNMPAPTASSAWKLGLYFFNKNAYITFEATGTSFYGAVSNGTNSTTSPITWQSEYSNVKTVLKIRWEGGRAGFYINGNLMTTITNYVPNGPLSILAANTGNTAVAVNWIEATDVVTYLTIPGSDLISNITFPVLLYSPSVVDTITVTDVPTLSVV